MGSLVIMSTHCFLLHPCPFFVCFSKYLNVFTMHQVNSLGLVMCCSFHLSLIPYSRKKNLSSLLMHVVMKGKQH